MSLYCLIGKAKDAIMAFYHGIMDNVLVSYGLEIDTKFLILTTRLIGFPFL